MMQDIWTVMRKELKELYVASKGMGSLVRLGIWVAILGIFLPLQMGDSWLTSPTTLFTWMWFPLFVVSSVIAGAFAGERERHTLETLLASRLSDQAILFGKIGAGVIYGWSMVVISIVLSVVVLNVGANLGQRFFSPLILVGGLIISFQGALIASGLGVLVSLRAPTARQAQQALSFAMMLLFFIPVFGIQALPQTTQTAIFIALTYALTPVVLGVVIAGLFVVSGVLVSAARTRFRRSELILD